MEQKTYKYQRKPNRLRDFDFSSEGAYFITMCVKGRAQFLSEIRWDKEENVGDVVPYAFFNSEICFNTEKILQQRIRN